MSDQDYGQYRPMQPISDRLKVVQGTNKNPMARQQKSKFNPQPLTNIKRGDRSNTIWSKRKERLAKGESIATVQTSSLYEADSLEFENPDRVWDDFDGDAII